MRCRAISRSPDSIARAMPSWVRSTSALICLRALGAKRSIWCRRLSRISTSATRLSTRFLAAAATAAWRSWTDSARSASVARFFPEQCLLQPDGALFVDTLGRQIRDGHLDTRPQLRQLRQLHAASGEIDGGHLGDSVGARRHDEEPTARPAAHAGDLMMLEQPHGLSQQRATHALLLNQLRFGPDELARLHPLGHDGLGDVARHHLGTLALHRLGEDDRIGEQLTGRAAAPEELCFRLAGASACGCAPARSRPPSAPRRSSCARASSLSPTAPPRFCQSGEYSCATRLKTSTKSSRPGLRLITATNAWSSRGSPSRSTWCFLEKAPQLGQIVLIRPLGRQLAREILQDDPGLEDLVETGVHPVQIEHHRVDDRPDGRLGDDEAASGSPPGARHLLMLHEAHRLTEHGPAHLVALEQIRLGAEDLADRPAQSHDVLDDEVRHLGRPLGIGVGARPRHVARRRPGGGHSSDSTWSHSTFGALDQRLHQKSDRKMCSAQKRA